MPSSGDLGNLNTKEWQVLLDLADSLEEAWKNGETVDLNRFLPSTGTPTRAAILLELIKTDLECRWRHGQAVGLDYYVEKFPGDLGSAKTLPANLVFEEFRVRHLFGDRPPLDQFKTRFPTQYAEVERLAKQHNIPAPHFSPSMAPTGTPASPTGAFGRGSILSGGYKLIERIGTGGFAEVWKAEAPGGVLKAIKIIIRPVDKEEAQRELQALELIKNSLRHHFLMPTHQFWPEVDRLVIVMDLADGSLRDCLNTYRKQGKQGIPLPELLKYFRQTAEAIDYLHSKKVYHRDIKPENILLTEGNVRVADFGLVKGQGSQRLMSVSFAGTPLYMPPEAWEDKNHLHGDQYSLAAAYFELRVGRRLYKEGGLPSLMQSHLHEIPKLDPLGEAEQKALHKALSKNPDDRYPTCVEFVHALHKAVAAELPMDSALLPASPTPTSLATEINTIAPGKGARASWARPDTHAESGPPWAMTGTGQKRSVLGRLMTTVIVLGLLGALSWVVLKPYFASSSFSLLPLETVDVNAGDTQMVSILIKRRNFTEPVHLLLKGDAYVTAEEAIAGNESAQLLKLTVLPEAAPGRREFTLVASAAGHEEQTLLLTVNVEPLLTLPKRAPAGPFKPTFPIKTVNIGGKNYYKHIECMVGEKPVRFVFVPGDARVKRSFYIMVDKVWNGLFGEFAKNNAEAVLGSSWTSGAETSEGVNLGVDDPALPVMRVTPLESHKFAEWLGGFLPSIDQWEKAAGRFEKNRGVGPYLADWDKNSGGIAIGRGKLGPVPVGTSLKDHSLLGCNDMAGNGMEWTRSYRGDNEIGEFLGDPSKMKDDFRLTRRGNEFASPTPLTFEHLEGRFSGVHVLELYMDASDRTALARTGFRVVLEVDS
ncbi:MAG: protein kinase [Planctomycetes bacterium]|nr:protein kinase [Planctomycetota bacterium]